MNTDRLYYLGFSAFPGIGPVRFKLLLDYFGSAKAAWNAPEEELIKIGLGEKLSIKFSDFKREFSLTGYAARVKDLGIALLTINDPKYPKLLKEITDAPFLLYIKGKKSSGAKSIHLVGGQRLHTEEVQQWDISRAIAIVGTRRITSYGREVTQKLASELVDAGMTIVSGLAYGVDAVAHKAAIEAGGKTIAVLGCGVDCCNPPANQYLYDQIIDGNGVIMSEFPLSQRASRGLFPARNRIVSGLSLGVVVTEGAHDSGALITARFAAEQGREVFAVPGPITSPYSSAPMKLLREGAKLVTGASDILDELKIPESRSNSFQTKNIEATIDEQVIIKLLQQEAREGDDIIRNLSWDTGKTSSILSLLEIKGIIKKDGGVYSLKQDA